MDTVLKESFILTTLFVLTTEGMQLRISNKAVIVRGAKSPQGSLN
jgi:hypothetical protein